MCCPPSLPHWAPTGREPETYSSSPSCTLTQPSTGAHRCEHSKGYSGLLLPSVTSTRLSHWNKREGQNTSAKAQGMRWYETISSVTDIFSWSWPPIEVHWYLIQCCLKILAVLSGGSQARARKESLTFLQSTASSSAWAATGKCQLYLLRPWTPLGYARYKSSSTPIHPPLLMAHSRLKLLLDKTSPHQSPLNPQGQSLTEWPQVIYLVRFKECYKMNFFQLWQKPDTLEINCPSFFRVPKWHFRA
jgi:hypothetical protein